MSALEQLRGVLVLEGVLDRLMARDDDLKRVRRYFAHSKGKQFFTHSKGTPEGMRTEKETFFQLTKRFPLIVEDCREGVFTEPRVSIQKIGRHQKRCACSPCKQRKNAALWGEIIRLYFRHGLTAAEVAGHLKLKGKSAVDRLAQKIRDFGDGKRLDNRPRKVRQRWSPGRPRKSTGSSTHSA